LTTNYSNVIIEIIKLIEKVVDNMKIEKVKIVVTECNLEFYMSKRRANDIDNVLRRIRTYRPCVDLHNIEIKISEVY